MLRPLVSTLTVLPLLLAVGCGGGAVKNVTDKSAVTAAHPAPSATKTDACGPVPVFDPAQFPSVPKVDNRWSPLVPGVQFTLDGIVTDEEGKHKHRIVTTVTDLTKTINGVSSNVVLDEDFQDGALQESEIFFNAQDTAGAVWLLGEFPAEYDKGKFVGAPATWIAGSAGAVPGVAMPANPAVGTPGYRQGTARSVGFVDCAKVYAVGQHTTVSAGTYSDVMVIDEWGPLDPRGGHQRKFYAPGIGGVRVGAVGGNAEEDLMLTKITQLCKPGALAKARDAALDLDQRAYRSNGKVYGQTSHAQQTLHAKGCGA